MDNKTLKQNKADQVQDNAPKLDYKKNYGKNLMILLLSFKNFCGVKLFITIVNRGR